MSKLPPVEHTVYKQRALNDDLMIQKSQIQELKDAFELFIGDQNKRTIRPSEMLPVFVRLGLDKDNASAMDML